MQYNRSQRISSLNGVKQQQKQQQKPVYNKPTRQTTLTDLNQTQKINKSNLSPYTVVEEDLQHQFKPFEDCTSQKNQNLKSLQERPMSSPMKQINIKAPDSPFSNEQLQFDDVFDNFHQQFGVKYKSSPFKNIRYAKDGEVLILSPEVRKQLSYGSGKLKYLKNNRSTTTTPFSVSNNNHIYNKKSMIGNNNNIKVNYHTSKSPIFPNNTKKSDDEMNKIYSNYLKQVKGANQNQKSNNSQNNLRNKSNPPGCQLIDENPETNDSNKGSFKIKLNKCFNEDKENIPPKTLKPNSQKIQQQLDHNQQNFKTIQMKQQQNLQSKSRALNSKPLNNNLQQHRNIFNCQNTNSYNLKQGYSKNRSITNTNNYGNNIQKENYQNLLKDITITGRNSYQNNNINNVFGNKQEQYSTINVNQNNNYNNNRFSRTYISQQNQKKYGISNQDINKYDQYLQSLKF